MNRLCPSARRSLSVAVDADERHNWTEDDPVEYMGRCARHGPGRARGASWWHMPDGRSGDSLQESLEEWRRDRVIARLSRATAATGDLATDPSVQATAARCGTGVANSGEKKRRLPGSGALQPPIPSHD